MAARPDAGWSWVIAFSCSYIHLALFGIFRSAGVIFVALLDTYDTTREEAAWPFSLCSAIFQLTAPIASVASRYFSVRKICLTGSIVATVGIACCFFAENVLWIIICYGIIHGLGFGLVAALVPVIVNQYFVKYRATGVGIAFSGGTVSTFIFPVAMEFFLHLYGLQGTFLILGGVVMNTLVASSMLRAPPWLAKKKKSPPCPAGKDTATDDCKVSGGDVGSCKNGKATIPEEHYIPLNRDQNNADESENHRNSQTVSNLSHRPGTPQKLQDSSAVSVEEGHKNNGQVPSGRAEYFDQNCEGPGIFEQRLNALNIGHVDPSDCSETNKEDTCDKVWLENEAVQMAEQPNRLTNDSCPEYVALLPSPQVDANGRKDVCSKYIPKDADCASPSIPLIQEKNSVAVKQKDSSAFEKKPRSWPLACKQIDVVNEIIEVLGHPMFHLLTFSMCFFFLTVHSFFMVIVDFAKDKGIPESYAIYVLSVFSATDLVGRAGLGWVTDRNFIKRKNMVMINMGVIGLLNNFYPIATTIKGLFTIAAFHGLAVGSSITLFFVLQAEYLGMKKLPVVIGLTSFINGITTFFRPGMTGLFRDHIGSYDWMFHFLGILMIAITSCWLAEPWLRKRSKNFDHEDVLSSRLTDIRKSSC